MGVGCSVDGDVSVDARFWRGDIVQEESFFHPAFGQVRVMPFRNFDGKVYLVVLQSSDC